MGRLRCIKLTLDFRLVVPEMPPAHNNVAISQRGYIAECLSSGKAVTKAAKGMIQNMFMIKDEVHVRVSRFP
jgi:hypothetical protein